MLFNNQQYDNVLLVLGQAAGQLPADPQAATATMIQSIEMLTKAIMEDMANVMKAVGSRNP